MIYFSTGGEKDRTAYSTVLDYINHGINNIELSGGQFAPDQLSKLIKLNNDANFLIHNYFPPPKKPFVFNLASLDSVVSKLSLDHAHRAIDFAKKINSPTYTFHAGFLLDPKVNELGQQIVSKKLFDRKTATDKFLENVFKISKYAKKHNIEILIENNVLSKKNIKNFKVNPLLLVEKEDCINIMNSTPDNVNLLIDLAHLKVSANSLKFDPVNFLEGCDQWIKGYHLSDNDGLSDSNMPIKKKSWFWKHLKNSVEYITIEVYGISTSESIKQLELVKSIIK